MSELGTLLVRAREARGLTLEDAERDTRISRRYLQALETEQFEAIPAPVYARGFLRSYSQYLGLDPNRMLQMFPREDDYESPYQRDPQQRASPENPISAVGASRPAWRRPQPPRPTQPAREAPPRRESQEPFRRRATDDEDYEDDERYQRTPRRQESVAPSGRGYPRQPVRRQRDEAPYEPMIGVDIGVPAPARRIKRDPAAQTRTLAVVGVAIGAIIVVILIAFLLSRAGGSAATLSPTATTSAAAANAAAITPLATRSAVASGSQVKVPDVLNLQQNTAQSAIQQAGLKAQVTTQSATQPSGTVINQAPSGDSPAVAGDTVYLVVSSGQ